MRKAKSGAMRGVRDKKCGTDREMGWVHEKQPRGREGCIGRHRASWVQVVRAWAAWTGMLPPLGAGAEAGRHRRSSSPQVPAAR